MLRCPETIGWPCPAQIEFKPNKCHTPRAPWPYETETRRAGTGLAIGCTYRRQGPRWVLMEC